VELLADPQAEADGALARMVAAACQCERRATADSEAARRPELDLCDRRLGVQADSGE
jgi:hypothetical protein